MRFKVQRKLTSLHFPTSIIRHILYCYALAQDGDFDDNKLMINKIKDFIKSKLSKHAQTDEEIHDADDIDESDVTNPHFQIPEEEKSEIQDRDNFVAGNRLEEFRANVSLKLSELSDRLSILKGKIKKSIPSKSRLTEHFDAKKNSNQTKELILRFDRFLQPGSRETIHQAFLVTIIALFTYQVGKITAIALRGTPLPPVPKGSEISINVRDDFNPNLLNQVKTLNPFRTEKGAEAPRVAQARCETASQKTSLPIKLVNAVVLQDEIKSLASVQVRSDRKLLEVRIGDKIQNMAEIFKITREQIVVRNLQTGNCEAINNDNIAASKRSPISVLSPSQSKKFIQNKKMPGIENQGNNFKISKTLINEKMKDIGQILTQAKAIPIQNPDGSMAFRITEMDPEGIFPYLGLQDQDIITSINGQSIQNINEVMNLFGRIKNLETLSLGIRRDGSEVVQEYNIQ